MSLRRKKTESTIAEKSDKNPGRGLTAIAPSDDSAPLTTVDICELPDLADVEAIDRDVQRRKVLLEREFETRKPVLGGTRKSGDVRDQELRLAHRQRNDDHEEYRDD